MLAISTHPDYDIPLPAGHRFPATKFSRLMARLDADGITASFTKLRPDAASREDVHIAHDAAYVRAIAEGTLDAEAQRVLGLQWSDVLSRRSFLSVNGTLLAARSALKYGMAAHAAGGTHHAHHAHGAGFCVFNDLAYASLHLAANGEAAQILVLDCDVHQGDGTARLLADHPHIFTCSVHCASNYPARKARSDMDVEVERGADDETYLGILAETLHSLDKTFTAPDIVLYDAGVDVHTNDRLGHLALGYDGITRRDAMVMRHFRERGVPIASVIGGGYGEDLDEVAYRHSLVFHAMLLEYEQGGQPSR